MTDTPTALQAGAAKREITTTEPQIGIKDPLFAKVLVLDDGATRLAIIAMDAVAIGGICDISDDFMPKLRARIDTELGIAGDNVLVNASHTHPSGPILCEEGELIDRTVDAVRTAAAQMTPVKIGVGAGHEDRITMNRTLRLKDGTHWTIRHSNPSPPDDLVESFGPLDTELGVIRVDRLDGTPLAVVYNFACHLLWGDPLNRVTANFTGVASDVVEAALGHDSMALFLQGAAGDVIDMWFKDFGRPRDVAPLGHMLAESILNVRGEIETQAAALNVISETIDLPRRTDVPDRVAALKQEQQDLLASLRFTTFDFKIFLPMYLRYAHDADLPGEAKYRYMRDDNQLFTETDQVNRANLDKYLAGVRAMEKLARIEDKIATLYRHKAINDESGQATVAAEVQGVRIGNGVLITSTTEVLTEVALNIKSASPHKHTFIAAFTNGYIHYGAPAADYDKGGYEVTECLLAPEWQQMYEDKAADILRRL